MLELMVRGRVRRVLVVVPPGLMEQWSQELWDKFGLEFRIIGNASDLAAAQESLPAGVSPWDALPRVITSVDYLKKETVRHRALRKAWDLIIVDEAHALAESGTPQNPYRTQRARLGQALREASRSLLLLTATPHNGYAHAFRSLLELVEPTAATFRGEQQDQRRRVTVAMIRRMKSQIVRPGDGPQDPVFPARTVEGIPVFTAGEAGVLLREVLSYCSRTLRQARGTEEEELIGFAMQIVKKRALSSQQALARTIEHRLEALEQEEAREDPPSNAQLREFQADLPLTETQTESTARRILRAAIPKDERRRNAEVRALKKIRSLLRRLHGFDPKLDALLAEVKRVLAEDPAEKVIVFTEYRDTLDAIRARFDADPTFQGAYVILQGGLTRRQRLQRQEQFARPETRLLLATDAASEGLNLQQHCRRVLHVELPWNPNRLEQRNGRVDRYGQTRPPIVRYLYYPDSPEEDVLSRLVQKIEQMAQDYVSTPDVLGLLEGTEWVQSELTSLDPEANDLESRKNRLLQLFEDRTSEFVRELKPLLLAGQADDGAWHHELDILHTTQPLLPDDEELEQAVLSMLAPKRPNHCRMWRACTASWFPGPTAALACARCTRQPRFAVRWPPATGGTRSNTSRHSTPWSDPSPPTLAAVSCKPTPARAPCRHAAWRPAWSPPQKQPPWCSRFWVVSRGLLGFSRSTSCRSAWIETGSSSEVRKKMLAGFVRNPRVTWNLACWRLCSETTSIRCWPLPNRRPVPGWKSAPPSCGSIASVWRRPCGKTWNETRGIGWPRSKNRNCADAA